MLSSESLPHQCNLNVAFTKGYTFIAASLKQFSPPLYTTPDNTLTHIIPAPPNGSRACVWDVTNRVCLPPATDDPDSGGWDLNFDLPVGKGFVNVNVNGSKQSGVSPGYSFIGG